MGLFGLSVMRPFGSVYSESFNCFGKGKEKKNNLTELSRTN